MISLPLSSNAHNSAELLEFLETTPAYELPAANVIPSSSQWVDKRNIAAALGINTIDSITINIRINVFTIGLDGHGAAGLNITTDTLSSWLEHLDHTSSQHITHAHLRGLSIPSNIATNHDHDQHAAYHSHSKNNNGNSNGNLVYANDIAAAINYRYDYHLIELSPRVTDVIHHVRYHAMRPVAPIAKKPTSGKDNASGSSDAQSTRDSTSSSPSSGADNDILNEQPIWQVNVDDISDVLDDLTRHLRVDDGYNIFILSPSRDLTSPSYTATSSATTSSSALRSTLYGYRHGFSNDEIDYMLAPMDDEFHTMMRTLAATRDTKPAVSPIAPLDAVRSSTPSSRVSLSSLLSSIPIMATVEQDPKLIRANLTSESDRWASSYLSPSSSSRSPSSITSLGAYVQRVHHGNAHELRYVAQNQYGQEHCLVDSWIGNARLTWLDLSAGPFNWGPIVGGQGVRTLHSLPHVSTFASHHHAAAKSASTASSTGDDDEDESGRVTDQLLEINWEVILAEKLVTEAFMAAHCNPVPSDAALLEQCAEFAEKLTIIADLENGEAEKKKGIDNDKEQKRSLHDMHAFSFFMDQNNNDAWNGDIETDHFLSHLSSVLSSTIHHVITPPLADSHTNLSEPQHGGYATQINYHIYVLSNHQSYDPTSNMMMKRLKDAVLQLRLPSQEFAFEIQQLSLDSDRRLSMAFTSSLRSAVVPTLSFDGTFSAVKRMYLDSRILQAELARAEIQHEAKHKADAREIPIFLFSLDYPEPVLIDKQYQAKALPGGMVVAVQSLQHLWETPYTCNNKPIFYDLRDPVGAIVASIAEALSGLLPLHVSHSPSSSPPGNSNGVDQDWLWSVGHNPLSITSPGDTFSQMQRDTLHRSYIIHTIRSATYIVNGGVQRLTDVMTSMQNEPLTRLLQSSSASSSSLSSDDNNNSTLIIAIQMSYNNVHQTLNGMRHYASLIRYDDACQLSTIAIKHARQFASLVDTLMTAASHHQCLSSSLAASASSSSSMASRLLSRDDQLTLHHNDWFISAHAYLLTAIICVVLILRRLIRPPVFKAHVN